MSRISITLAVILAGLLLGSAFAEDPSLEVNVNRNEIYLGESVILQVKVSGSQQNEPDLSQIKGCRIRRLGSQSSSNFRISIVNGIVRREGFSGRIFSYELTPHAAGEFVAGPIRVAVGNQTLSSEGPRITVTGTEPQEWVRVEVRGSRPTVLVDESFEIAIEVQIAQMDPPFADVEPLDPTAPPLVSAAMLDTQPIAGLKCPDVAAALRGCVVPEEQPGIRINNYTIRRDPLDTGRFFNFDFNIQDMFEEKPAKFALPRVSSQRDGRPCHSYTLKLAYTAQEEGNYTFGPVLFKGPVVTGFESGRAVRRNIFAVGPAFTVRVVPPPEDGCPASFVGTLGSNMQASARLDTQACKVGDPIRLTLSMWGDVRLDKILPPRLGMQTNLVRNFAVYDDTVESVKREDRREYVYKIRPLRAGTLEIPPIPVSYYDLSERGYRTVQTAPLPLKVLPSAELTGNEIIADTNRLQTETADRPTQPPTSGSMRTDPAGAEPASLIGRPWILGLMAAGPLTFLAFLIARSFVRWRHQTAANRRRKRAVHRAIENLEKAQKMAVRDPHSAGRAAYDALRGFIADRFDVQPAAVTPSDAVRLLSGISTDSETVQGFSRIMETLFNASYGIGAERETQDACAQAIRLLRAMETSKHHSHDKKM